MFKLATILVLITAVPVTPAAEARSATVSVQVTDIASAKGQLMISLCDQTTFGKGRCQFNAKVPARRGSIVVRFANVPNGRWAAAVYHDENGNGALDRNGLGIPTEGGGFSRDARGKYGWPTFADAAMAVGGGSVIPVSLNY